MNPSQSSGSDNGAAVGSRASKKRRVTFGADEAEPQHQETAGVENFGGDAGGTAAVSSAGTLTNEQVDQYLPYILRSDLNALIRRQLVQGIPLTLSDLVAAPKFVPYQRSRQIIPTCREGWNGLDENLMRDILFRLNLREKVICTSMVCKAWSELKGKTPGLFVDLGCPSGPGTAVQMASLIKWIPDEDAQACTSLRIATSEGCSKWAAGGAVAAMMHKKQPILKEDEPDSDDEDARRERNDLRSKSLIGMKKLFLAGPKIKNDLFLDMLPYVGVGPSLTHFGVDSVTFSRRIFRGFLLKFTSLQFLEIPPSLVSTGGLCQTLSDIRNVEILRVLDLTKATASGPAGEEADNIHWKDVAFIGKYCPKLEILKLPAITHSDNDDDDDDDDDEDNDYSIMIELTALRTFSVGRIIPKDASITYFTTGAINGDLMWLLHAMPNVENFSFGRGECEGLESELLPGISRYGIQNFPSSLRKLHLRDLNIEPSALASSSIDMDTIESITMENCGSDQVDALKIFCRRYHDRGDGTAAMPSLGVSGDSAFMVRGPASFPADAIEIDE